MTGKFDKNMNLTDEQKTQVRSWIENGAKISEIQNRLGSEFGLRLTYMEVRFLVDDLKVALKDPEPPPEKKPTATPIEPPPAQAGDEDLADDFAEEPNPAAAGKVSVTMDSIAIPGAAASGQVTFSDGQTAQWYLDQYGRLGLSPKQKGYRPPASDLQAFQMELQKVLAKLAF